MSKKRPLCKCAAVFFVGKEIPCQSTYVGRGEMSTVETWLNNIGIGLRRRCYNRDKVFI